MRPLAADRPGVTENPVTVDAGHLQFETDLGRIISSKPSAAPRQRTIRANAFVLKMGLSNRTDVQLFIDAYEWDRTFATAGQPATRSQGFGDVTLRLKHNLLGNDSTEGPLAVNAAQRRSRRVANQAGASVCRRSVTEGRRLGPERTDAAPEPSRSVMTR